VIDYECVISTALGYYREAKGVIGSGEGPWELPSDQIRALARALVEAINETLSDLNERKANKADLPEYE
jgi:hypothetical protein